MSMISRTLTLWSLLALIPLAHGQSTLLVPEQHPTIQGAIAAAVAGDTVSVAPGAYPGNLDFLGKAIVVRSRAGAPNTIVTANVEATVVRFVSGEGRDSILDGFTITGGAHFGGGGGILVVNSAPTIRNCIIRDNAAWHSDGGGIYCDMGRPLIQNCAVHDNGATFDGPGMFFRGSHGDWAVVLNCVVYANTSWGWDILGTIASLPGAKVFVANTVVRDNIQSNGIGLVEPGYVMNSNFTFAPPTNGNINVDPRFLNAAARDFHLRADSPNRDAGLRLLPQEPGLTGGLFTYDFEGDPRLIGANPDIGVDEYTLRLMHTGTPTPGATIEFRIIGTPPGSVCSAWMSSQHLVPPLPTAFGVFHLADRRVTLLDSQTMPSSEQLLFSYTLPHFAMQPDSLYAQAFDGGLLSNLDVVRE